MRTRRMHEITGQATWVIVLETGDEAMTALSAFAAEAGLDSASFTAIGAFERAVLAFFDWEGKEYLPIVVDEQVESPRSWAILRSDPTASRRCMCMRCWAVAMARRWPATCRKAACGRRSRSC